MSSDAALSSPSSPRKRQLGFATLRESPITFKVESMETDGMDDLWAELGSGNELAPPTEHMDYDDLLASDEIQLPDLIMPSLTNSNQSESVSDMPISPTTSQYEQSPPNKELIPSTNLHSTDSIAQMLEYMRACNNSQDPPPASSTSSMSNYSETQQQQDQVIDRQQHRYDSRKLERSTSRNNKHRKQLSPGTQKLTRSFSHGSDSNQRPNLSTLQQKSRQRTKTTNTVADHNLLHIDTSSAVEATGPFGIDRDAHQSRHRLPVSAGSEPWSALQSPGQAASVPSWPESSTSNQKNSGENLSLSEFLKRPEGAMWFQHFQNQYPPRTTPDFTPSAAGYPMQQQQSSLAPPTPSIISHLPPLITAHLPPPMDVASMLGLQQAPNQALVQAFQTAFVLGMQQLGMAGQFQTVVPPQPVSQPYPFSWNQEHQSTQASIQSNSQQTNHHQVKPELPTVGDSNSNVIDGESRDASSVLQSLLHDINQHRPDKQEFSLDEFLAFVANTVESTGDESNNDIQQHQVPLTIIEQKKGKESEETTRRTRKTVDQESEISLLLEKKKSSSNSRRRRTISISGQLSGTYLDDVAEDSVEGKKSEPQDEHHHKSVNEEEEEVDEIEDEDRGGNDEQHHQKQQRHRMPSSHNSSNTTKTTKEKEANKLAERRRRRRESHNAVERRRRDHINERIAELASLLPESMLLDAIAASTSGGTMPHIDLSLFTRNSQVLMTNDDTNTTTLSNLDLDSHRDLEIKANSLAPVHSSSETLALAQSKPNKGIILSKIVEYIKHLHEFCSVLRIKNTDLQAELDRNKVLNSTESVLSYQSSSGIQDSTMATATPPSHLAI